MGVLYYCVGHGKDYQAYHFKPKRVATPTHISFFFPDTPPPQKEQYFICTQKLIEFEKNVSQVCVIDH